MQDARDQIPKYHELFNPVLKALRELGGSATISEIEDRVAKILDLPSDVLECQSATKPSMTVVNYRLAWARSYLNTFGLLQNSQRGVWSLCGTGSWATRRLG